MTENGDVADGYAAACEEREQLYPTGLQLETTGVALPHADSHYVKRSAIAVATLLEPVTFRKMGDPAQDVSVRAVFMLAPQKGEEQLLFLEGLVAFFQQKSLLQKLFSSSSAHYAAQFLQNHVFERRSTQQ